VRGLFNSLRCCLNPKVIGSLAAAGLLLWLIAPASGAAALPVLLALVCPLSMGAMAWQMRRRGSCAVGDAQAASQDVDAQLRDLREELAIARAQRSLAGRDDQPLT
jgi:hypothetical protein